MATTSEDSMRMAAKQLEAAERAHDHGSIREALRELLTAVAYLHDAVRQARLEREDDGK